VAEHVRQRDDPKWRFQIIGAIDAWAANLPRERDPNWIRQQLYTWRWGEEADVAMLQVR
jgi:hypothetical protein